MRRCWRKQPDAPLASRNLLRPLPVRTEGFDDHFGGRSWRSRISTNREGQQRDGHDLFAELPDRPLLAHCRRLESTSD
jgi:hypothetical protein